MNRGVFQSSPVQQMMAGNPNWWSINSMRPPSPFFQAPPPAFFPQYTPTSSSSSSSSSLPIPIPIPSWHDNQDRLPESWSQLLLGGLVGDEEKCGMGQFQASNASVVDVKQENTANSYVYHEDFHQTNTNKPTWSTHHQIMAVASSPKSSCVTSFSSNMPDFSGNKQAAFSTHSPPELSSECNSTATGGALKKARVQPSATESTFKVRREKLGDRITALHQLVSPFGKTDTASVLLETIGYIRFLQSQIQALSLPYLGSGSGNMKQQQQSVQGERNCIFPEDPGQLLNDNCMKRKGGPEQDSHQEPKKDLRSRGLCLVPVSCILQVGGDNGADYWAPAALGGGFR